MDFSLSAEQLILRDVVRRYCADHCGFDARRKNAASGRPTGADWRRFAELGWLGVALPEDVGGAGGSAVDRAIILEEFGRAIVVEPFLSCIALAGHVVNAAGSGDQRRRLLGPAVRGELLLALAHRDARHGCGATLARSGSGDSYFLSGGKTVVLGGGEADVLLVSARCADAPLDTERETLFVVRACDEGLARRGYSTLDGLRACDVVLDEVRVDSEAVVGEVGGAAPVIREAIDHAMVAACAEMVGAMEGLLWLTRDYLRQRRQYGIVLGSLQALQHRMAEMFAELELSRSMLYQGLRALESGDADARRGRVAAVKAYTSASAQSLAEAAIQLHGGIGMAAEYKASHYFKRILSLAGLFGTPDAHLQSCLDDSLGLSMC